MESYPLVSVVVPAHNYAEYLPQAIDSALAQDWPELEVIVVDDGSTDATPEVVAAYGDRIRALRQPNGGVNAATGAGIAVARGDLLAFLDADDSWRPNRVRLLAEALIAHPDAGLVWGDMEIVDRQGRVIAPSFRRAHGIAPLSGWVLGRLLQGNFISAGAMMVRASLRDRYHPIPEYAAWQDWWIAVRVAEVAQVLPIEEPVNLYRHHERNMNLGADTRRLAGLFRAELPFRRWLLEHVPAEAATPRQWATAVEALDAAVERAAGGDPREAQRSVEASPADRVRAEKALADGRSAFHAGDPVLAVARSAAAIAASPGDLQARALLAHALPLAVSQAERAQAPEPIARSLVTFALIDELEADPSMLAGYATTVGGGDDATLVVGGVDHRGAVERLQALIRRAGMESEDAADVLAVQARDPAGAAAEVGRPIARRLDSALVS